MDANKVREAIAFYRKKFEEKGIPKEKFPGSFPLHRSPLPHCHAMLDEMEVFIQAGKIEKVFRWLGFIQGCLWTSNECTLEDLKNHNRPID